MVQESSLLLRTIEAKENELQVLREEYKSHQAKLQKLPEQLSHLTTELSSLEEQKSSWASTRQQAENALATGDDQWVKILHLLPTFS